jgi:tetratricopeptide (TPR) repeat protein
MLCPFLSGTAAAGSSADELVRQARAHEDAHEEDVAVRRYTEALMIDGSNADAWAGLGALRMRLGDPAEAERVYSAALERAPWLRISLVGRARARWALGRHAQAEEDLESYAELQGDAGAYRELADWYGMDGRTPAQLATWRRLLASALETSDTSLLSDARRTVRALVILVDGSDTASSPVDPDPTRRVMAQIARQVR